MNDPHYIVYFKLKSGQTLHRVIGPPELVAEAESRDKDNCRSNHIVCSRAVPYGAEFFRFSPLKAWQPIGEYGAVS